MPRHRRDSRRVRGLHGAAEGVLEAGAGVIRAVTRARSPRHNDLLQTAPAVIAGARACLKGTRAKIVGCCEVGAQAAVALGIDRQAARPLPLSLHRMASGISDRARRRFI